VLAGRRRIPKFLVGQVSSAAACGRRTRPPSAVLRHRRRPHAHQPANLSELFHRSIEAETTERVMRVIFADAARFVVHRPPETSPTKEREPHQVGGIGLAAVQRFRLGRSISGETP